MLRSRSFESTLQQAKRIKIQSTNLTVNYSCHCYYVNVIPLLIHPLSTFSLLGYPSLRFNDPPSRMVIENQRSLLQHARASKQDLKDFNHKVPTNGCQRQDFSPIFNFCLQLHQNRFYTDRLYTISPRPRAQMSTELLHLGHLV